MQLWTDLEQVPPGFGPSVVTIGNFDGVHRGHQAVLRRILSLARSDAARAVAVTFHPHPAVVHRPESAPELITGLEDRLALMERTGLDATLLVSYTLDFAAQTPEEFVARYLVDGLGARTVVVGHDVRFGKQNAGTLATMVELGGQHGFEVVAIEDVGAALPIEGDGHQRWSSTAVRALLAEGDVDQAADVLGRPHLVRGTVVHGDARGREMGFPTANLGGITGLVPADGVYAGWLRRGTAAACASLAQPERDRAAASGTGMGQEEILPAAISVGTNPTFDGVERRVEAYVLDRTDLDLYDQTVALEFVSHLRPTLRFDGMEPLIAQMNDDVARSREILRA
ncbi:bifunctional riboflavin kinase/FAD synthetase [Promicromonospora soli]|uniref:Riboflavin biosynthesis protein n=1 Tax=Promicromonospora soli TaxID=2035533 RepID=A0A919KWF6_9MICO|nr:bifunctional riboflavin kinase/FAD synthetase [Promicromonospora soli]GHH74366.1 riboflavin biosynthesis protein [Promicromonospora soli]